MNNKIVFFRYLPLTRKVKEDFYMSEMASWGYDVEYWDMTTLFFNKQDVLESYQPTVEDKIKLIYILKRKDFVNLIINNKDALYVSLMSFGPKLIWIFRLFKKYNCKNSVFSFQPLPLEMNTGVTVEKILNIKRLWLGITSRISVWMFLKIGLIRPYTYVFKGGKYGWRAIGLLQLKNLTKTIFYEVNYWDYDKFLKAGLTITKDPFIVFLDEYYPFHPDIYMFGQVTVDAVKYYSDLNRVFSAIEDFYGMPVVIAAHPKALKYTENNYFEGREVRFNSTLELVSKSSLVLAHDSLSIGFAIMCKKPLVFVNSYEIRDKIPESWSFIRHFSQYFHSPVLLADEINVDVLSKSTALPVEVEKIYDKMIEDYMTTLKEPLTNDILIRSYLSDIFSTNDR